METILVVDDTGSVLKGVVAILEAAKFHVLQAGGGSEAVRVATEYPRYSIADGHLLASPFWQKRLLEMVTELLHIPDKSQGSNQFDKRKDNASK